MGFSDDAELQPVLVALFLFMYLVTVLGNLLIILVVSLDSHLHTPMYFFLSILSLDDIGFISTTVSKAIVDIQTHSTTISLVTCLTQMSLFGIFACMDDLLLTVMAYDRFVSICHPLRYPVMMNQQMCGFLVLVSFLLSVMDSQLHNMFLLQFNEFKGGELSNFFCDPSHLINLVCADAFFKDIMRHFAIVVFAVFPVSGIFLSYYKIVSSIMKISSKAGRFKAFSTCGSHLSIVCLFYGTSIGVYFGTAISKSPKSVIVAFVICTVVTPMLNPFIYSLRNRDIHSALRRIYNRVILSQIHRQKLKFRFVE